MWGDVGRCGEMRARRYLIEHDRGREGDLGAHDWRRDEVGLAEIGSPAVDVDDGGAGDEGEEGDVPEITGDHGRSR